MQQLKQAHLIPGSPQLPIAAANPLFWVEDPIKGDALQGLGLLGRQATAALTEKLSSCFQKGRVHSQLQRA